MFNIALTFCFLLAMLFSPGKQILLLLIDTPVLMSLPPYQGRILLAFANYFLPTVIIYFILRWMRTENWIRPNLGIHIILGLGNSVFILYVIASIIASSIQGGGASFVLHSYASYVILPARGLLGIGLIWLIISTDFY